MRSSAVTSGRVPPWFVVVAMGLLASSAAAQTVTSAVSPAPIGETRDGTEQRLTDATVEYTRSAPGRLWDYRFGKAGLEPPRDSLKNGVINGAVVGALALGGLAAVVCGVYESRKICMADTFRFAAIGAAIGAGTGVIVDAALTRNRGVRLSVGFRF